MRHALSRLLKHDDAATAVEYAVLLALILLAIFGAIGSFGSQAGGLWGDMTKDMQDAGLGK